MVFWKAKTTRLLRHTEEWVHAHAEILNSIYHTTVAHTTHLYTKKSLREWQGRIQQQVQLLWEHKQDVFDFYAARCATPRGVKRYRIRGGAPFFERKKAQT